LVPVGELGEGLLVGVLGAGGGSADQPAVTHVGVQDVGLIVQWVLVGADQPASVTEADTSVREDSADDQAMNSTAGQAPSATGAHHGEGHRPRRVACSDR
jgi:hypothetical protein